METLLIFVTLLTAVAARNIPNTDYVPTKDQLAMIFGGNTVDLFPTKSKDETPTLVPNESVNIEKNIGPYENINESYNSVTPKTVELNIKIKVNDCEKKGADKNEKQNPEKSSTDIHSRFDEVLDLTEDRVSLGVNECPSGKVRLGKICVVPDNDR